MQQGAKSATPPARKAASTEPVVSRLLPITDPTLRLGQSLLELAPREAPGAEVRPVQQDQRTHRRPVRLHQGATGLVGDRHHVDSHRIGLREGCQARLRVLAQMARGCLYAVSYTHLRAHETVLDLV